MGSHRERHTKQERRDKSQLLQIHVPRGVTAQGSSRVEGKREDKPWLERRGHDWKETPLATPPQHGPIQNTPERGHPGEW